MDISPLNRPVSARDLPLEKLAGSAQVPESEKVAEVSRQFEAVLVRQILSNGQKTHFKSKHTSDSASSGVYKDMITVQMADGVTQGRGLGLARVLAGQMDRAAKAKADAPEPRTPPAQNPYIKAAPTKGGATKLMH
jgi:Rod binding domain-containing protein